MLGYVGEQKEDSPAGWGGLTPPPSCCQGQVRRFPLPTLAHLEEVDLHTAITEVQDDGTAGAEPGTQVGQPGQLITFPWCDIGPCLQQVFAHVVSEILEEGDLVGVRESRVRAQPWHSTHSQQHGPHGRPARTFFVKELGWEFTVR